MVADADAPVGDADPPPGEPCLVLSHEAGRTRAAGASTYRSGTPCTEGGPAPAGGVWATWSWDGRALRAENDRYGMRPLFYAAWPGRLAISPSVPALLAAGAPADLDEPALAVFLRVGFFLGEDTPFRAIRALPPCARFEWRDGALHVSGQPPPTPRPQRLSRAAAIEGYIDLFRAAIARRLVPGDDAAVPLSGGRDSRHILLELCRAGRPPRLAVTMRHYPPFSDEDAVVATDVARAAGVPHVVLPQGGDRFAAEIEKNRRTGFCADEHAWMLPLAAYLRGRVRYAYDGIGGDVLSAGLFLTPERVALAEAGRLTDLAAGMAEYPEPWLAHLLAPAWAARLGRDVAIERLVHELARHVEAPNPIGSFYFWNRTRREIALAPYRILGASVEVLSPYLDDDLYDFLASLPATALVDGELHSETIRRAYPEHRGLRFEDRRASARAAKPEVRRFARRLAAYAARGALIPPRRRLVRAGRLLTRALWSSIHGNGDRLAWCAPILGVYLLQLSRDSRAR